MAQLLGGWEVDAVEHLDEEQGPLPLHGIGHSRVHLRVEICFSGFKLNCAETRMVKGTSAATQDLLGRGNMRNLRLRMITSEVACLSKGCSNCKAEMAKSVIEAWMPIVMETSCCCSARRNSAIV